MATCASCREELPPGARFCPSCGHEVLPAATEERRVVTVVFADLVGYSSLSEHLDPERVKRLIDAAFERLIDDITTFGGRVDKVLGDGLVALFGAPVAHEDDADRAIRAALAMHDTIRSFAQDEPDLGGTLELRIGVNTGEVLVGAVSGTADYTAMGDVVNVASRLQVMAPAGAVYIGDSTAALASDAIVRELVDVFDLRGRTQLERVWRVLGRRRRLASVGIRTDLPFVGRATQRELLSSLMAVVAGGRSAVVAVTGEAGAGKTRLISEALDEFPGRAVSIYAGVCAPYGENNVWSPIATALLSRFEVEGLPSPDRLRDAVRAKAIEAYGFAADDLTIERFVECSVHLLGFPSTLDQISPAQAREALYSHIIEGLRRRSAVGPVVLWIDDLQWADVLIVELLHRVARSLADRPVLVITAQRDDVEIDWPPAVDHPITVRMPLEPLERGEAGELVRAVFGRPAIEALIDQLYERSGGNPLFLTELAELARENPASTALPGSLRALIAARLDRLPAHQRAIIDNASVLGAQGTAQALGHFAAEMGQSFDVADLEALAHDGLLEVRGNEWRFRSDVVREVAYQTLTKLVRAQRHAGTAAVMAELPFVPSDQVAHHAARAAELVAEIGPVPGVASDVAERAARLLHDAAHRSLEMGAFNQAVRHTTRALDLGVDDDHLARELLLFRAQAQTERRAGETARADALDALERSLEAGDRCHEAIGRRVLGVLHQRDGDLTAARRELGASVDIFRELDDDVELSVSLRERGFAEVFGGSLSDAEWLLGEAEALSERLEDRRGRAWVRQHQAWVAFLSGDTELAETRLLTAAQEFDLLGDRSGGGWAMGLLAYVRFYQRRFDEAEKLALRVRAESIQMGDPWAPAMMDSLIAGIRLWTCRFSEAEELARRALSAFRQIGDRFGAIQAMSARLRALVALGRLYEAERGMEEALAISDSFGDLSFPAMTAAGAAVHMGIGERAVLLAEIALARSTAMGAERSEPLTTLALALCQVGRADEALAHVEEANARSPYVAAVVSLTAALVGDDAAAIEAADAVWDEGGSTYLDRVIADVAAATAFASTGDVEAARCRLERARATALDAGDVVARELAVSVTAAIEGEPSPPDADHLGPGWRRVVADVAVRSGSAPSTRSHTPAPSP